MADPYTTATQLAVLQAGRAPKWTPLSIPGEFPPGYALPPQTSAGGVPLEGATKALAYVALRENPLGRTAKLVLGTVNLTAEYQLTIGGTMVSYDANAGGATSRQDIVEGIIAAIEANPTTDGLVSAEAVSTFEVNGIDTVKLVGKAEPSYSFGPFAAVGGGTTSTMMADIERATVVVWFLPDARPGNTPPAAWVVGDRGIELDHRGWIQRYDVAGLQRMHLQILDVQMHPADAAAVSQGDIFGGGAPHIYVGPCLEAS